MTFTANSKNITTGVGKNNQTTNDQRVVIITPKYNHHSCFDILKISVLGVVDLPLPRWWWFVPSVPVVPLSQPAACCVGIEKESTQTPIIG